MVIERNPNSWASPPAIERVRFAVVPDSITRALELQKGSADVAVNALTADQVYALRDDARLVIETGPGTILNYISFNARDPILKDARVRQAIAYAINRPLIIHALWRDHARLAENLLPKEHWAWTGTVRRHDYDPALANALLDAAGLKRGSDGVRFHLTIKTSTDETSRTLAVASSSPRSTPTSRKGRFRCIRYAGSAATRTRTSSATRMRRPASPPTGQTAGSTATRRSTLWSPRPRPLRRRPTGRRFMGKSSEPWRKISPRSTSGISTR